MPLSFLCSLTQPCSSKSQIASSCTGVGKIRKVQSNDKWNNLMYSLTEFRTVCISMFRSKITTVGITAGCSSFVPEELQSEDDVGEKARGSNNKWWAKAKFLSEAELWVPLKWGAPDSQEGDKARGQFHCWMMSCEFSSLLPRLKICGQLLTPSGAA